MMRELDLYRKNLEDAEIKVMHANEIVKYL